MKKFLVNVNGTDYEITVEQIEADAAAAAPAKPAPQPVAEPTPAPAAPAAAAPAAGETINAPMPGTILSINVKVGDKIKAGQVLMILEAMKMENEIMAPADGTVTAVGVTAGATVDTGAMLCAIG